MPEARIAKDLAAAESREEVLGLALGAASACWENLTGAGEFDSTQARAILDATVERLREMDGTMMPGALSDVSQARVAQIVKGYNAEHDDAHGLEHIVGQARKRTQLGYLKTRDDLVEAAACLVAAVEWMDRQASPLPPHDTTTQENPAGFQA